MGFIWFKSVYLNDNWDTMGILYECNLHVCRTLLFMGRFVVIGLWAGRGSGGSKICRMLVALSVWGRWRMQQGYVLIEKNGELYLNCHSVHHHLKCSNDDDDDEICWFKSGDLNQFKSQIKSITQINEKASLILIYLN